MRLSLFASAAYGSRESIGDEKVEADAFFFGSVYEQLVQGLGQADGKFARKLEVVIVAAARSCGSLGLGGVLGSSFAGGQFAAAGELFVGCRLCGLSCFSSGLLSFASSFTYSRLVIFAADSGWV